MFKIRKIFKLQTSVRDRVVIVHYLKIYFKVYNVYFYIIVIAY